MFQDYIYLAEGCTSTVMFKTPPTTEQISSLRDTLLDNTTAGIALVRFPDRTFLGVNRRLLHLMGLKRDEEIVGHPTREFFPDHASYLLVGSLYEELLITGHTLLRRIPYRRASRDLIWLDLSARLVREDTHEGALAVWTLVDSSEQQHLQAGLVHQATHDPVTGLPNRRALDARLENAVAQGKDFVLCILDLDDFAAFNTQYGHALGDEILRRIARRFMLTIHGKGWVAGLGGDEFVLLLDGPIPKGELEALLLQIEADIGEPIILEEGGWSGTLSMGLSHYPSSSGSGGIEHLIRQAAQALYISKSHKKDRTRTWMIYGEELSIHQNACQTLLMEGAVAVYYQPIIDTRTGTIVSLEALARMKSPAGDMIHPQQFLSEFTIENTTELTRMVLTEALSDLAKLDQQGFNLDISFNLAPQSIGTECIPCLKSVVDGSGIASNRITAELLESGDFLEFAQALHILNGIRDLGIHLALDDVGSAYSSLLRVKNLPIDKIKLDQGFIRTLGDSTDDLPIVRAVQDLALDLGLELVAEGVETPEVLDAICTMGIPYVQGYAISPPLSFEKLQSFLRTFSRGEADHPQTLFGFYAGTMVSHSAICKMLLINPAELNLNALPNARHCRGFGVLERLGYPEASQLGQLHQAYHYALGKVANHGAGAMNTQEWKDMEAAFKEFMATVQLAWHEDQRDSMHVHLPRKESREASRLFKKQ